MLKLEANTLFSTIAVVRTREDMIPIGSLHICDLVRAVRRWEVISSSSPSLSPSSEDFWKVLIILVVESPNSQHQVSPAMLDWEREKTEDWSVQGWPRDLSMLASNDHDEHNLGNVGGLRLGPDVDPTIQLHQLYSSHKRSGSFSFAFKDPLSISQSIEEHLQQQSVRSSVPDRRHTVACVGMASRLSQSNRISSSETEEDNEDRSRPFSTSSSSSPSSSSSSSFSSSSPTTTTCPTAPAPTAADNIHRTALLSSPDPTTAAASAAPSAVSWLAHHSLGVTVKIDRHPYQLPESLNLGKIDTAFRMLQLKLTYITEVGTGRLKGFVSRSDLVQVIAWYKAAKRRGLHGSSTGRSCQTLLHALWTSMWDGCALGWEITTSILFTFSAADDVEDTADDPESSAPVCDPCYDRLTDANLEQPPPPPAAAAAAREEIEGNDLLWSLSRPKGRRSFPPVGANDASSDEQVPLLQPSGQGFEYGSLTYGDR
jgi:hypothetical protein